VRELNITVSAGTVFIDVDGEDARRLLRKLREKGLRFKVKTAFCG